MKRLNIFVIMCILLVLSLSAQDWNPFVDNADISPAPLLPLEFNGTGQISLNVGNKGSSDMDLADGAMILNITLSNGIPNAANPLDAIDGTWADKFDWTYNSAIRTFTATQNQDMPSASGGGVMGTITIEYEVAENTSIAQVSNGFNVNIVPPSYVANSNVGDDDVVSTYTYVQAFDYGDAPASYGEAVHEIDLFETSLGNGVYANYMYFGSSVDPETNQTYSLDATGDDANDSDNDAVSGENDEDGVIFPAMVAGTTVTIPVQVGKVGVMNPGLLNAWIDWNGNGSFFDAGEQVTTPYSQIITFSEVRNISVNIPANAITSEPIFARFRIGDFVGAVSPSGSATYGEVEDYQITIQAAPGDVSGHLYIDANGNGIQDSGETDMPNVDVVITDSTNGAHTVTTDSSGDWTVTVTPGSTTADVDESDPDFITCSYTHTEGTDPTTVTAVSSSVVDAGNDGYFIPVCVVDSVWLDINGDGVHDVEEPGVSNMVVHLLDESGVMVAERVTDENGECRFTNMAPAIYQLEVVPTAEYAFTIQDAEEATELMDSDVAQLTGLSPLTTVAVGETNLIMDAGIYVPAALHGYLFEDEDNNYVRNTGDTSISNALVTLTVNGITVATTNTDAMGSYQFSGTPVGSVTLLVSRVDANLVPVPLIGTLSLDEYEARNRALPDASTEFAYVSYSVVSGYGVLDAVPSEPLNFGFDEHPLSTSIDLKVYDTGSDGVLVEISTVNENGSNDIEIYAMIDSEWILVACVPSGEIIGFGSNTYIAESSGLIPGESYLFKIVDESGHIFYTDTPIEVAAARLRATEISLTPEYFTMTFNTEPFSWYVLKVNSSLAEGSEWSFEYVQVVHSAFPDGVSGFYQEIQGAPEGTTTLRVPRNREKAFYKIIKIQ